MKFSDGYWQTRPGFTVLRPAEVAQAESDHASLTVLVPTKPSTGRGWDLNLATATITLTSPMAGVIRVRVEHHRGPQVSRSSGPGRRSPFAERPAAPPSQSCWMVTSPRQWRRASR